MIDFACKTFKLEEIIKCGLNLTKSDFQILNFLIKNSDIEYTSKELSKILELDLTTLQRGLKKIYEKNLLRRMQKNLDNGYVFYYQVKDKKEIKELIINIIHAWTEKVDSEIKKW